MSAMNLNEYLGQRSPANGETRYPARYVNGGAFAYAGPGTPLAWCDLGGGYFYVMPPAVVATPEMHAALAAHVATLLAPPAPVIPEAADNDWQAILEEPTDEPKASKRK